MVISRSVRNGRLTIEPQPVLRLSSLLTARDAVTAGAGAALLPQSIHRKPAGKRRTGVVGHGRRRGRTVGPAYVSTLAEPQSPSLRGVHLQPVPQWIIRRSRIAAWRGEAARAHTRRPASADAYPMNGAGFASKEVGEPFGLVWVLPCLFVLPSYVSSTNERGRFHRR